MTKILRMITIVSFAFMAISIAAAQTYTTVDYPGATATTLNGGPNPQGTAVGTYTDTAGVTHGFTETNGSAFTSFDPPGSTATTPNFITPQGTIVGGYLDASGTSHGFVFSGGHYTNVDYPGAAGTVLTSQNPEGEITGFSCADAACANGPFTSFTRSATGTFNAFNPPGSSNSQASAVNPAGVVVGAYEDSAGVLHGYILYRNNFVTNDYPGASFTFDGGNNAGGVIVGEYRGADGVPHSFVLNQGVYTGFDPPGATASDATGVNPGGVIVGLYADSAGAVHGFIRTP